MAAVVLAAALAQPAPLWAQGEEPLPAPTPTTGDSAPAPTPTPVPQPERPPPPPLPTAAPATKPAAPAAPAAPPAGPPPARAAPAEDDRSSSPGSAQRIFGWTAIGVGSATTVAGLIIAGVAAARLSDLDCCDDRCPPDQHEDAESYNDLRVPAGLTILAGAALIGLGVPFLVVGQAAEQDGVAATLGPGGIQLRGRF